MVVQGQHSDNMNVVLKYGSFQKILLPTKKKQASGKSDQGTQLYKIAGFFGKMKIIENIS